MKELSRAITMAAGLLLASGAAAGSSGAAAEMDAGMQAELAQARAQIATLAAAQDQLKAQAIQAIAESEARSQAALARLQAALDASGLQAADECQTLDKEAYSRLLNVANIYKAGRMHGVLPCACWNARALSQHV